MINSFKTQTMGQSLHHLHCMLAFFKAATFGSLISMWTSLHTDQSLLHWFLKELLPTNWANQTAGNTRTHRVIADDTIGKQ